nr:LysR substrate-binding domain-containing protein [Paludibacterium yongneupense]
MKTRLLFHDRFIGICRAGHPLLSEPGVTAERYAGYPHVIVSRKRQFIGPVDDALAQLGLRRTVVMVVPGYANAMQVVRNSDLIGLVPLSSFGKGATSTTAMSTGLQHFERPVPTPPIKVSTIWHPRLHADPAHRWLRKTILAVCKSAPLVNE